jgi:hypothetical protein
MLGVCSTGLWQRLMLLVAAITFLERATTTSPVNYEECCLPLVDGIRQAPPLN